MRISSLYRHSICKSYTQNMENNTFSTFVEILTKRGEREWR
nr:MAG TPA: hypothetical protein [Caudoviricetes sp.]